MIDPEKTFKVAVGWKAKGGIGSVAGSLLRGGFASRQEAHRAGDKILQEEIAKVPHLEHSDGCTHAFEE